MKIDGNNPVEGKELYNKVQELNKNQDAGKIDSTQSEESGSDKISLSGRSREIHELKGLIENLPDIRTDRVEEVKKAIDSGNYNIDSLKVAEKVLEEI